MANDLIKIEQFKNFMFEVFAAGFISCTNGEDLKNGFLKYWDIILKEYYENER